MSKKTAKLLVVETHGQLRAVMVNILQVWGYEVETAENGDEGLRKVREMRPTLIFCELYNHGPGCLEFLKAVKAEFPGIKFVLTGTELTCERGQELGASFCVRSPMTPADLQAALEHCLGHSLPDTAPL